MVENELIETLKKINSLYNSLVDLIKSNCLDNCEQYARYITSIQDNSVVKALSNSENITEDIEWVIITSRNLNRYFDEINRLDFSADFFEGLDRILQNISVQRKKLVEILNKE